MKRLIFGEGLMIPTITGKKRITLRRYRPGAHDFVTGEVICGEFADGLAIPLTVTADTEKKPFSALTDEEARQGGYENAVAAFEGLKKYYPDLQKSDPLALVRYEVYKIAGGIPAVAVNRIP